MPQVAVLVEVLAIIAMEAPIVLRAPELRAKAMQVEDVLLEVMVAVVVVVPVLLLELTAMAVMGFNLQSLELQPTTAEAGEATVPKAGQLGTPEVSEEAEMEQAAPWATPRQLLEQTVSAVEAVVVQAAPEALPDYTRVALETAVLVL